ncbi:MAG: pyruvate flavodoxin/ferredoxin oxidoreductase [Thermoleophilia bacterium]|nr:pyruvate flavodoxin/ferredoxin oxidoreductase [Thermoleophilia bacterium]
MELVSGNRLTALGALSAGCRFFAGYPITPSSEIYRTMVAELPRRGGVAIAAPDEISAAAACVGASLGGHRAMTATSGPGFCLMIETIQYAVMTETPLVVCLVQRLGPSTGGATQGAQGDVLLAAHCVSGGVTIPVFAPAGAAACYRLARAAFEWSERLRTPVVLLSDKEIGMTLETVDVAALGDDPPPPARRPVSPGTSRFAPYRRPCPEEPPDFAPVGGPVKVVVTGSAHDTEGRLSKSSPEVVEILSSLQRKIDAHAAEMACAQAEPVPGADTLVVSYGVSARAALEACRRARARGHRVSFLGLETLFPVPLAVLEPALAGCSRVLVVEENLTGLYAGVLEPHLGGRPLTRVTGLGGMIPPARIEAALAEAA